MSEVHDISESIELYWVKLRVGVMYVHAGVYVCVKVMTV